MKASFLNHRSICLSAATLALISTASVASAQRDGKPGVDSTPAELREPRQSPEQNPTTTPETGVTKAQPIELETKSREVAELEASNEENVPKVSITSILGGSEDFTTLATAIKAAELGDVLKSEGPFTVFAPSNEAFEALPEGVLETLLLPENKDMLKSVLSYHVIEGQVLAADVTPGALPSVQKEPITFVANSKGEITIQGAKITSTDVMASNGVVHVIDKVLVPPTMTIEPTTTENAETAPTTAER